MGGDSDERFARLLQRIQTATSSEVEFERRLAMLLANPDISEELLLGDLVPVELPSPVRVVVAPVSDEEEKHCEVCTSTVDNEWVRIPSCRPAHYFCVSCAERCVEGHRYNRSIRCTACRSSHTLREQEGVKELTHTRAEEEKRLSFLSGRCPFHDALLIYFCMDCMEPICGKCQNGYHATHDYDSLDGTLAEMNTEMNKLQSRIRNHKNTLVSNIESMVQQGGSLRERIEARQAQVRREMDSLRELIDTKEADMLRRLEHLESSGDSDVERRTCEMLDCVSKCDEHLAQLDSARSQIESATPMEKIQFIVDNLQVVEDLAEFDTTSTVVRPTPPLPSTHNVDRVRRAIRDLQFY